MVRRVLGLLVVAAAVLAGVAVGASGAGEDRWAVRDLGVLREGDSSRAVAINAVGLVVGTSEVLGGDEIARGFVWREGRMRDLGPVGADPDLAVNDKGVVVGSRWVGAGDDARPRAFVWRNGMRRDLRIGARWDRAFDVNDAGQVVGDSDRGAWLWQDGRARILRGLGWAHAVDDSGRVFGGAFAGGRSGEESARRALMWAAGRITVLGVGSVIAINDTGQALCDCEKQPYVWTAGRRASVGSVGPWGWVTAINARGQVIGTVEDDAQHAFLWTRGTRRMILPARESSASALDDQGRVVGVFSRTESDSAVAYVWENGRATSLPTHGGEAVPTALNNRHQIVGTATTKTGQMHAVLWTKTG